jgi:hypothetical protein
MVHKRSKTRITIVTIFLFIIFNILVRFNVNNVSQAIGVLIMQFLLSLWISVMVETRRMASKNKKAPKEEVAK